MDSSLPCASVNIILSKNLPEFIVCFQLATTSLLAVLARLALGSGVSSFPTSKHGPVGYHGPLAKPVVQKDGHLADTVEVAAARGQHLIATLKAQSASGYGAQNYDDGSSGKYYDAGYEGALHGVYSGGEGTSDVYNGQYGYAGLNSFSSDGHYASSGYGSGLSSSNAKVFSAGASAVGGNAYHGPLAAPVVLKSGFLADTADVASAKGAHYVALSQASQKSGGHY